MAELSQAIRIPTIQGRGGMVYDTKVIFTYQPYFQISYNDDGDKVLKALGYKFQRQSKEGKINLVNLNDKKNKNLTNLLDRIVIRKGEQVTIYTKAKIPPEIINNP